MLSARTTLDGLFELANLLEKVESIGFPKTQIQKKAGKLWLASDWRPEHLIPIYEHFEDRVSDLALSGELRSAAPKPVRATWG